LPRAASAGCCRLRIFHAVHLPPHLQGWRIDNPAAGGGVIPDITVHDADVTRFLLGEDPVNGRGADVGLGPGPGGRGQRHVGLDHALGRDGLAHESFTHPFAGSGSRCMAPKGSIFARGVMTQRPWARSNWSAAAGRETVPYPGHDLYTHGGAEFAAAAAGTGRPAATGEDGVKSLAVALAVREAAATGTPQTLNYGDAR
jgi:1,5-anhydro-D-fructose reductase (1,5-anhydro-D-mannitol-forming)